MPVQLFPITFKGGGIIRDGTQYQNEFCTDGQWVRFYQGKPKKIGGQLAIRSPDLATFVPTKANCIASIWLGGLITYICINETDIYTNIASIEQPHQFLEEWEAKGKGPFSSDILWQAITVIVPHLNDAGKPTTGPSQTNVILFSGYNKNNINNSERGIFYKIVFEKDRISTIKSFEPYNIFPITPENYKDLQNLNGGICFIDNLLFSYGTQGTLAYSRRRDPYNFDGGAAGSIPISADKIIYVAGVRGGNNPPTLICWTMNSVVKVSNQSDDSTVGIEFSTDVIAQGTSILSSRCVVEHDGMFFWLGIDRIFLYNGVVREVVNNTNFDWFFKQLDVARRQLVFGIRNAEKGEIWWYFPTKDNRDVGCSHALIYNIRENTWYDTKITRDCGFFDGFSGKMITYGKPLVPPPFIADDENYIWIHEEGTDQIFNDGTRVPIESSFTTPIFSLTAFNPLGEGPGIDNLISLTRIEPDMKLDAGKTMEMVINSRYYASSETTVSDPITLTGGVGKVDLRFQGRNLSFTFTTVNNFQVGHNLIAMQVGDGR